MEAEKTKYDLLLCPIEELSHFPCHASLRNDNFYIFFPVKEEKAKNTKQAKNELSIFQ